MASGLAPVKETPMNAGSNAVSWIAILGYALILGLLTLTNLGG